MEFMGWSLIFENKGVVGKYNGVAGYKSSTNGDLWFCDSTNKEMNDYDRIGVNHISIRVDTQKDVDSTIEFLGSRNVKTLFNTPRHRPEFCSQENETYYQIMFESPDKILFEIVYIGPKD